MPAEVMLYVEVAGCPTICQHCWAQGVPYPAMPLADFDFVLDQVSAACAARDAPFSALPRARGGGTSGGERRPMFQPLSTTGAPLALRSDWEEVLATCRELGEYWVIAHLSGMIASYVVLLTAFYVDNAHLIPGLNRVPTLTFWVAPTLIAIPFLVRSIRRFLPKAAAPSAPAPAATTDTHRDGADGPTLETNDPSDA